MTLKTLNLHLTNRCNMRCRHCLYSCGEKIIKEMDYSETQRLIKEFSEISDNKGTLNLFGGEVFVYKNIFTLIDSASSNNLNVGITTNANFSQDIINRICRLKISRLAVDIDGANPASHDWLKGQKGHFKKSLEAIKCFSRVGKFTASNIVLHKKNVNEVEDMLKVCQKAGVNFISFYLFTSLGRGKAIGDLVIGPKKWKETRERVKKWINKNSPNFGVIWERSYEYVDKINSIPVSLCQGGAGDVIDVRCDGNVYYCGLLSSVDFGCLGNVKKEKLKKILNRRKKCAVGIKSGCAALAYNQNRKKLIDPRSSTNEIVPVCPYDWEVMRGASPDLKSKFAHINL